MTRQATPVRAPDDIDLTKADVLAWDPVLRAIESQHPIHPPYAGHVYQAMTLDLRTVLGA